MKTEVRKRALAARRAVGEEQRAHYSHEIACRLFETEIYRASEHIMCYADYNCEVQTHEICERILADKKTLYLPRCGVSERRLTPCAVSSLGSLKPGAYGIPEPEGAGAEPEILQLVIVPMTAFDRSMGRMGYGGGYYDRFLAETHAVRCGIAFAAQEVSRAAFEKTDLRMDIIITERELIGSKE